LILTFAAVALALATAATLYAHRCTCALNNPAAAYETLTQPEDCPKHGRLAE